MSDNQIERFRQLTSEGKLIFKAASYTQSEDSEHPEHIAFRLENSSEDAMIVFGVWRGMSPDESRYNMLLWDFYVTDTKTIRPFIRNDILTLPMLQASPAQKCSYADLGKAIYTKMTA